MEVALVLDIASTAPSYRAEINRIAGVNPDAVIIASQAQDGGTLVKQAAEAGEVVEHHRHDRVARVRPSRRRPRWTAIGQHKTVLISGFANMPRRGLG